jgi:hypothetical protein
MIDGAPDSPWSSGFVNGAGFVGENIPVPNNPRLFGIPEPSTIVLFAVGLFGVGLWRRRKS